MCVLDDVYAEGLVFGTNISRLCGVIKSTTHLHYEDIFRVIAQDWDVLGVCLSLVPMAIVQLAFTRVLAMMVRNSRIGARH